LEKLSELYIENGGNYTQAFNALSEAEQGLINRLEYTDTEL
jgi:hypothetical protein